MTFLTLDMFRAAVPLPATAPPGNYEVEVILFSDTVMLARDQTNFELVKIGLRAAGRGDARDWAVALRRRRRRGRPALRLVRERDVPAGLSPRARPARSVAAQDRPGDREDAAFAR